MPILPPGLTPYGRFVTLDSHAARLETQLEVHGRSQDPPVVHDSITKASYLILSLPSDRYWYPFITEYILHYNSQLQIHLDGGEPHYTTWEELVPQAVAHQLAKPFWVERTWMST